MPLDDASAAPPRSLGSTALTCFLVLLASGLAIWLGTYVQPESQVDLPSNILLLATSDVLSFKKQLVSSGPAAPLITHVQILDVDEDGRPDVLVCDAARNSVILFRRLQTGDWEEQVLADGLIVPAHATVVDLDQDGDRDVVVAILGDILPSDRVVGRVVWLERDGDEYRQHVLLDDVRRVADVQAGDLDGDGDIDLSVAVFGYSRGEVLWLEQLEPGRFVDHLLLARPGTIHVPIGDYDGDGDLDIATVVSQDEEEIWGLENQGQGQFAARRLHFTHNYDAGSGGLVSCDLDQDGDLDFLVPWGDNLEYGHGWPQPYHGCIWFENRGEWQFVPHRVAHFGGTYAVAAGDIDQDGDLDLALVSMSNDWSNPAHASVAWLENDGRQKFRLWQVDTRPAELITVACGDLDGDGRADIVAGRLHLPTSDLVGDQRVVAWLSKPAETP
jgi:hypothetical protein